MAERARLFDGKKFLWDGVEYESEEEARRAGETRFRRRGVGG